MHSQRDPNASSGSSASPSSNKRGKKLPYYTSLFYPGINPVTRPYQPRDLQNPPIDKLEVKQVDAPCFSAKHNKNAILERAAQNLRENKVVDYPSRKDFHLAMVDLKKAEALWFRIRKKSGTALDQENLLLHFSAAKTIFQALAKAKFEGINEHLERIKRLDENVNSETAKAKVSESEPSFFNHAKISDEKESQQHTSSSASPSSMR